MIAPDPHPTHADLCYHYCPVCKTRLQAPFLRGTHPIAFLHRRRGQDVCRILILPGTTAKRVSDAQSLEDALLQANREKLDA